MKTQDPKAASGIVRGRILVGIEPSLRSSLGEQACGRSLVIDSYRSWHCGTWIGDLTVGWHPVDLGPDFVDFAPIDRVRLFANRRLLGFLRAAGSVVRRGGLPFRRGLGINLERPDLWIDYLDHPASFGLDEA